MKVIGLDFETHYDSDYSLSKMPTHQYIRDPRFRCLGCGFQFGLDGQPFYVEGVSAVQDMLDRIPWDRATVVCHNTAFDGSVLFERFGRRVPAFWLDTQLIARWAVAQGHLAPEQTVSLAALAPLVGLVKGDTRAAVDAGGQTLADYGTQDVRIMMALLRKFLALRIPPEELTYMDMHIRMTTEPVLRLDRELLQQATVQAPSQAALHALLRKDANFVRVLDALGVPVEYKVTPKGKRKPALAKTDTFMQALLAHDDPGVAEVAELRLSAQSNILRTRAQRFLDIGEPLPVPLIYYGAHTGRASGTEINPQNLPRKGPLRAAVTAPEGCTLVVGDSRQIEARLVGWQAGDAALMETFESSDPYRTFAGRYMFGCDPADVTPEQRQIGKAGVLGLGYGQGVDGFMAHCLRNKLVIDRPTAQAAVDAYRNGFAQVPRWWKQLLRQVQAEGSLTLPTGRRLLYPDLTWGADDDGRPQMFFQRPLIFSKGRKGERQAGKIWHGALAENCLALDTLVLTRDGWVALREVGNHEVWDGEAWVSHEGLTQQQNRITIQRNGVRLTPDHEVLTDAGWKPAAQSEGFTWADVRLVDGGNVSRERREAEPVGLSLPLWPDTRLPFNLANQWGREALRFCGLFARVPITSQSGNRDYAWHEQASGLLGMAVYGGQMPTAYPSGLAQLRRARDYCVRGMGQVLRRILGGHGSDVSAGADVGTSGQRARLLAAKLPVGYISPASKKQTHQSNNCYPVGSNDGGRSEQPQRDRSDHASVSTGPQLAHGRPVQEAVADLKNCGPRNRFVVCAPGGVPFVAHNCTQAVARDVVFWQVWQFAREWAGRARVVWMTHDEAVVVARVEDADSARERLLRWLRTPPPWADGLRTDGEVHVARRYSEAK